MRDGLLSLMMLCIICFIIGIGFGVSIAHTRFDRECINRGLAKYEVDSNGNVKFVWVAEKKGGE